MRNQRNKKTSGYWALGLLDTMKDPESIVMEDDLVVVIKDKYPKAEYHYLVLPKADISSLKKVNKEHLSLLQHMQHVASDLSTDDEHKHKNFKMGYHAEASMARLHLHLISDDMVSSCLKTKKHWNSYNSSFFLSSADICQQFEAEGVVKLPKSEVCRKLLDTPLKCHKCSFVPKHMPNLKDHILSHK
uniref:HIT domain-containing protein n=1 Tax=Photinus pyralis TaxID=7054 RepID=A0A1Y1N8F8_PHOPY